MNIFLDTYAPRTNALMGALVSGGDAIALAKQLCETQNEHCNDTTTLQEGHRLCDPDVQPQDMPT